MNVHSQIKKAALLNLTGALLFGAAACGSSSSAGSSTATPSPAASTGSSSQSMGTPIDVTLKNYSITVKSSGTVAPGVYTFQVSNQGPLSHNLTVNGPGVSKMATPTFSPGSTETLTVTLKNGTYELYCSVPGHKQLGMDTKLVVGSGAGGGGSSSGGSSSGGSSSGGGWA
jgi:uncharacterized cupredoxin-like copper-binding protein